MLRAWHWRFKWLIRTFGKVTKLPRIEYVMCFESIVLSMCAQSHIWTCWNSRTESYKTWNMKEHSPWVGNFDHLRKKFRYGRNNTETTEWNRHKTFQGFNEFCVKFRFSYPFGFFRQKKISWHSEQNNNEKVEIWKDADSKRFKCRVQ